MPGYRRENLPMKALILAALLAAGPAAALAGDIPDASPDAKPVPPQTVQVYADVCFGAKQPTWCAMARDDANLQGSTGDSGNSQ